jgi:hypothetical protein
VRVVPVSWWTIVVPVTTSACIGLQTDQNQPERLSLSYSESRKMTPLNLEPPFNALAYKFRRQI